jgi:hypothetical protein
MEFDGGSGSTAKIQGALALWMLRDMMQHFDLFPSAHKKLIGKAWPRTRLKAPSLCNNWQWLKKYGFCDIYKFINLQSHFFRENSATLHYIIIKVMIDFRYYLTNLAIKI